MVAENGVRNEAEGARGPVVQARTINGDVTFVMDGAESGPATEPWSSAGKSIAAYTARELGVHDAVVVVAGESGGPPRYVMRRHDHELRELLRDQDDRGVMLVLVGASATGKTRAAYEAVRAVPRLASWPVVRPSGPHQLRALFASGAARRCVLWLDDVQRRFLDRASGGELAERLHQTLTGAHPVLIVADMWTSHWNELRQDGSPGGLEWRADIRVLLDLPQVRMIKIPESFAKASPSDRDELERCARLDPRVALAVRTAGVGLEVTQVLSGGPQLLSWYNDGHYSPHAQALVTAAMDARRLGHEAPVAPEVLRTAAEGYLDDRSRVADGDWFGTAMADATRQWHGVAALTPTRQRAGLGEVDGYVLHDFLDHHARNARARQRPPASLWTAMADYPPTATEDLARLAAEAQRRGLYRLAARFAVLAAEAGDPDATRMVAWLFELRGATAQADGWRERTADPGDARGGLLPSWVLSRIMNVPDTSELYVSAESGDRQAMRTLVKRLRLDRMEEAVAWARRAADPADPDDAMFLADVLRDARHDDEAASLLREHANAGYADAMWRLYGLLDKQDRDDEALQWVRTHAETGHALARSILVTRLQRRGRETEAEEILRAHAHDGEPETMWHLGEWLANGDQVTEAVGWFQRSAEHSTLAADLLVDTLQKLGHLEAAEPPLRQRAENGDPWGVEHLADLLERLGRVDEATSLHRAITEDGDRSGLPRPLPTEPPAMRKLIDLLNRTDRSAEAQRLRAHGIEPGGATADPWELPTTST